MIDPKKEETSIVVVPTANGKQEFDYWYDMAEMNQSGLVIAKNEVAGHFHKFFRESDMQSFKEAAYASPDGYAIRVNPVTGDKEMFIAGTHSPLTKKGRHEWGMNLAMGFRKITPEWFDIFSEVGEGSFEEIYRDAKAKEEIAESDGVVVVYGHSQGAAKVSWFDKTKFKRVGLNGASFIAEGSDLMNIKGDSYFDRGISTPGKKEYVDYKSSFHDVTKEKKEKSTVHGKTKYQKKKKIREKLQDLAKQDSRFSKNQETFKIKGEKRKYYADDDERPSKYFKDEDAPELTTEDAIKNAFNKPIQKSRLRGAKHQAYEPESDDLRRRLSSRVTKKNHRKKKGHSLRKRRRM